MKTSQVVAMLSIAALAIVALATSLVARDASEAAPESGRTRAPLDLTADRPPSAGRSSRVTGTVRRAASREPLPGALVCASPRRGSASGDAPPFCAESAADGRYVLAGLTGPFELVASLRGFRPEVYRDPKTRETSVAVPPEGDRSGVDLELMPGGAGVEGRVRDPTGGVVAGARVVLASGRGVRVEVASDARGIFSAWLDASGGVEATASADGYCEGAAEIRHPGETMVIDLWPASYLVGRVIDAATRAPVAGADVEAISPVSENYHSGTAVSGLDGRFRIADLAPARYQVSARVSGRYGHLSGSVILGAADTSREVVVELYPAVSVSVRAILADGTPCPNGYATLAESSGGPTSLYPSEREGTMVFTPVSPGRYWLEIACHGYVPATPPPATIDVGSRSVELAHAFTDGLEIRGQLRGSDDVALEGRLMARGTGGTRAFGAGDADDRGDFTIRGLVPGIYRLDHGVPGYLPTAIEVDLSRGESVAGVRVVLERGERIEGRVRDHEGRPLADVPVRFGSPDEGFEARNVTETGEDGAFAFEGLNPGNYLLAADPGGWDSLIDARSKTAREKAVKVTVARGEVARVELVARRLTGVIRGVVVDEHGTPVDDARIEARLEVEGSSSVQAAEVLAARDGRFTIEGLEVGRYLVCASRRGGGEVVRRHVELGSTLELALPPASSLAGVVSFSDGGAPESFVVEIYRGSITFSIAETFYRTNGRFEIEGLAAGRYQVEVTTKEGSARTTVEIAPGQRTDRLEVIIARHGTIRGRVVDDESGAPIARALVTTEPTTTIARYCWSDASGHFELESSPGAMAVIASADRVLERVVAEVKVGEIVEAPVIRLPRPRHTSAEPGDLGFDLEKDLVPRWPAPAEMVEVDPAGPAGRAGVVEGDVIVGIDGQPVATLTLGQFLSRLSVDPGTAITLDLARGARVVLTARKNSR